jgi:hypothetical protein
MNAALLNAVLSKSQQAVFANTPGCLASIYQPEVTLSVWQRQLRVDLLKECQKLLDKNEFNGFGLSCPVKDLAPLRRTLAELGDSPALARDILYLVDMFSCLFDIDTVGIRLTVLDRAMCPKFHVDRVACRLITSYVGVGTEWLPHHIADRSKLGAASKGIDDANSGLYPSPNAIQRINTGEVALLKGESWEGNEGAGLIHRSPALFQGQQRLLLTLDLL